MSTHPTPHVENQTFFNLQKNSIEEEDAEAFSFPSLAAKRAIFTERGILPYLNQMQGFFSPAKQGNSVTASSKFHIVSCNCKQWETSV